MMCCVTGEIYKLPTQVIRTIGLSTWQKERDLFVGIRAIQVKLFGQHPKKGGWPDLINKELAQELGSKRNVE